jgi:hypothetical protein
LMALVALNAQNALLAWNALNALNALSGSAHFKSEIWVLSRKWGAVKQRLF